MAPTALITGGGTGIGAAVARRMAADGFAVCVAGRRPEPLEALAAEIGGHAVGGRRRRPGRSRGGGRPARWSASGASTRSSAARAPARAARSVEQTLERWDRVLATNLTGVFLTCQAALPHLIETRGAIVTVASLAGLRAAPASVAYGASKAGAIMLTQCIAVDHGPQGVRANCVCPGWIRTEMADRAMDELGGLRGTGREGAYELATAPVPARRPGEPGEVADLVAWLAGPQSTYVNGAVVTVDGGSAVVDAASLAFGP